MRYKVKLFIGLYQCVSVVPSAFNVETPPGLEGYTRWIDILEIPSKIGLGLIIPDDCFGAYQKRLLISAVWPIMLISAAAITFVAFELKAEFRERDLPFSSRRVIARREGFHNTQSLYDALGAGLQRSLPVTLIATFVLVPNTI